MDLGLLKKEYLSGKSSYDLAKKFGVDSKTILNRLNEIGICRGRKHSEHTKQKISKTLKEKGIKPIKRYSGVIWNKGLTRKDPRVERNIQGLLENRKTQVLPIKDTTIEVKIQNFLKQLGIEFYTHQYMKIEHSYQCDILIPSMNLVIECDGDYWHKYPTGRDIDHVRTSELLSKGFKVLRLWENEIRSMTIDKFEEALTR